MPSGIEKKPEPEGFIIKVGPDNTLIIEEMDQGSQSKIEPIGRMPYKIEEKDEPIGLIIKVGPDNTFIIEEMPPERF